MPVPFSALIDLIALLCLAGSWWEKRALDQSRNGFIMARLAMVAVLLGTTHSLCSLAAEWQLAKARDGHGKHGGGWVGHAQLALFRAMLFLSVTTGPSAAASAVLIVIQCAALRGMTREAHGARQVAAPVMAAVWRLAIRHVFFATNHHCSFNRLQFSAAFVATGTFQFFVAGSSLFMNTFGWEMLGSCLVLGYSRAFRSGANSTGYARNNDVWDWFRFFQSTEILASCLSVRMMKRHLMVWAIFAPRFMFAAVFTAVSVLLWVLDVLMRDLVAPRTTYIKTSKQQIF
jgi:phosphatidylinositol glycan class O